MVEYKSPTLSFKASSKSEAVEESEQIVPDHENSEEDIDSRL